MYQTTAAVLVVIAVIFLCVKIYRTNINKRNLITKFKE